MYMPLGTSQHSVRSGSPRLILKQKPSPQTQEGPFRIQRTSWGWCWIWPRKYYFFRFWVGHTWKNSPSRPFWRAASLVYSWFFFHLRLLFSECRLVVGLVFKGKSFTVSQWTSVNHNRWKIIRESSKLCFPLTTYLSESRQQTQKG